MIKERMNFVRIEASGVLLLQTGKMGVCMYVLILEV